MTHAPQLNPLPETSPHSLQLPAPGSVSEPHYYTHRRTRALYARYASPWVCPDPEYLAQLQEPDGHKMKRHAAQPRGKPVKPPQPRLGYGRAKNNNLARAGRAMSPAPLACYRISKQVAQGTRVR